MNLEFLKELVEIDSRTHVIEGVNKVQKILSQTLTSLDFDVKLIKENQDKAGDLLWAQRKGQSTKAITLVCHADTVLGPTESFKFKIDYHLNRLIGPGIGDNKGGIALLLGSIKDFLEVQKNHYYTLNIVCSPSEEMGSIGFHEFFKELGKASEYVFGFEPALKNGDIINERSGNRWYEINIKGKSAHAGRWNEPAINSAHIASKIISEIDSITSFEKKRRVNVAAINSHQYDQDQKFNIICENINLKLDTRFKDFESLELIHSKIISSLESNTVIDSKFNIQSSYDFKIIDDCPPMERAIEADSVVMNILEKIKIFEGKKVNAAFSGGAADVNYFQRSGLVSIDGLGPVAGNMHTEEEYIELESFYTRRHIFTELLMDINNLNQEVFNDVNRSNVN